MKQLRVLQLPSGWDASPLQGYPQQFVTGTHLYTWQRKGKVSSLRKQHYGRDWVSNCWSAVLKSNPLTTTSPHHHDLYKFI